MFNLKFHQIWKWGIATILAIVLGVAMSDLVQLPIGLKYFWILLLAVVFFVSLAILQAIWILVPKIILFLKTPNPKNLHLYTGSLYGNIYILKFLNTEWRYLSNKISAYIKTDPFDITFHQDKMGRFEWRKQKNILPLEIQRFVFYEINFLEIDSKKNEFLIKAKGNENFKFFIGKYGFKVYPKANINKIESEFFSRPIYLIVNYKGKQDISIKIVKKQEYEKHKWSLQKFRIEE